MCNSSLSPSVFIVEYVSPDWLRAQQMITYMSSNSDSHYYFESLGQVLEKNFCGGGGQYSN